MICVSWLCILTKPCNSLVFWLLQQKSYNLKVLKNSHRCLWNVSEFVMIRYLCTYMQSPYITSIEKNLQLSYALMIVSPEWSLGFKHVPWAHYFLTLGGAVALQTFPIDISHSWVWQSSACVESTVYSMDTPPPTPRTFHRAVKARSDVTLRATSHWSARWTVLSLLGIFTCGFSKAILHMQFCLSLPLLFLGHCQILCKKRKCPHYICQLLYCVGWGSRALFMMHL